MGWNNLNSIQVVLAWGLEGELMIIYGVRWERCQNVFWLDPWRNRGVLKGMFNCLFYHTDNKMVDAMNSLDQGEGDKEWK